MFRDSTLINQFVAGTARLFQAPLKRLGDLFGGSPARTFEHPMAESGFHVLDDVACIRIRRR